MRSRMELELSTERSPYGGYTDVARRAMDRRAELVRERKPVTCVVCDGSGEGQDGLVCVLRQGSGVMQR